VRCRTSTLTSRRSILLVPDHGLTMQHIRSYYAASAHPAPLREPLRGEVTADVWCGRRHRRVLTPCTLPSAATGRAARGQSASRGARPDAAAGSDLRVARGRTSSSRRWARECRRMFDVSVEALDLLKDRVARHAIDCDLHWGQMHVAIKPRHETSCGRGAMNSPRTTATPPALARA